MREYERGVVRPLWLAIAVLTCVVAGTTLNKCLTCGEPVAQPVKRATVVRGELIDAPAPEPGLEAKREPEPEPEAPPVAPAEDVTPGPESPDGPVPGPPADTSEVIDPIKPLKPLGADRPKPEAEEPQDLREYLDLSFDKLASYVYEFADIGKKPEKDQIPQSIKKLDGRKVVIKGFMIPLKTEEEHVTEFVLLRNQGACCFGVVPRINEWIHVRMAPNRKAPYALDIPLTVFGTLEVGEVYDDDGILMSLYRMEADRVVEPPAYR